jgi:hypothetical protein
VWDRARELTADWLMVVGGAVLLASMFLTWSHQFPASLLSVSGLNVALRGVPRNPTAWQVYSVADVFLALLAAGLVAVALLGRRGARAAVLVAAAIGLGFALHALAAPPTNGLDVVNPAAPGRGYIRGTYAGAGPGETLAVVGLALGVLGAGLGLRQRLSP